MNYFQLREADRCLDCLEKALYLLLGSNRMSFANKQHLLIYMEKLRASFVQEGRPAALLVPTAKPFVQEKVRRLYQETFPINWEPLIIVEGSLPAKFGTPENTLFELRVDDVVGKWWP